MTYLMLTSLCSGNILKFATQLEAKTVYILSTLVEDTFQQKRLCVLTAVQMSKALHRCV